METNVQRAKAGARNKSAEEYWICILELLCRSKSLPVFLDQLYTEL
jgi:hypothetical protein